MLKISMLGAILKLLDVLGSGAYLAYVSIARARQMPKEPTQQQKKVAYLATSNPDILPKSCN